MSNVLQLLYFMNFFKVVKDMDDIKSFNWELAPKLKIRND